MLKLPHYEQKNVLELGEVFFENIVIRPFE